jgi:putative ABC transport system permease protein
MPDFLSKLPRGVRRLFRLPQTRGRMVRESDEELRFHFAMRVAEFRALGWSEADAESEAVRRFGDTEEYRTYFARRAAQKAGWHRASQWFAEWAQDVRFATRQFTKAPAFTLIAILTLALGIGANTAIFSVVHRLLLAPLPYPNGNRIVMPKWDDDNGFRGPAGWSVIEAWEARGKSVDMVAVASENWFDARPDGTINYIVEATITSNYMQVLGLEPVLGRGFTRDDERSGAARVAMISYAKWQREYGGRNDVLGSQVRFNDVLGPRVQFPDKSYAIIGVTPAGMGVPMSPYSAPDIWTPSSLRDNAGGRVFARLRRGSSAEAASRELQGIAASLPDSARGRSRVRALRPQDFLELRETRSIQVLFVAVGALLLIACANVANLLLARAWTRRREFSVRVALGAGRWRLARQILTESLVLALAGGVLGIGVAWQTLRIIIALRPPQLEHLDDVHIEPAVLLWTLAISVATGILFGCAPALFAGARKVGDVLRNETRAGTGGVASRRVRSALIVLEIAASLVLLVGSGLLVRSFFELQRMRLGFEPRGLVQLDVITGPRNRDRVVATRDAIMDRVRALPGVTSVAIGAMPGKGFTAGADGLETDAGGQTSRVAPWKVNFVAPDYFRVARVALIEGRLPDSSLVTPEWKAGKSTGFSLEVLVSRELARRLRPNGHAIGARVRSESSGPFAKRVAPWSTVVGVVDDIRMPGARNDPGAFTVYSLFPPRLSNILFVARTALSGEDAVPAMERAIKVDKTILVRPTLAGETHLRDALAPSRFSMALLTAFAVIAALLAAVGLYGVIAYGVTQRTREIGVRVALGADARAVAQLVVGGGLRLAAAGVAVGAVAAVATTRVLDSMLYAVSPLDPVTFGVIAVIVAVISVLASYVPARRAVRIDPTEALRAD